MTAKALRVDGWLNGNEQTILSGEINGAGELPVTADDFFFPDNKIIFNRVRRLKRRGLNAVVQALDRNGELKRIAGGEATVTVIASLPHDDLSLGYALDEVLSASRQRRQREICQRWHSGEITPEQAAEAIMSLNSLGRNVVDEVEADDFPEPLDEVAFHGLAGDIVRRIEPHTEADPVALLVHLLATFGSAVDRNPHAVADGARHGANITPLCVGHIEQEPQGTALAHTKRVVGRADESWLKRLQRPVD